MPSATTETRDRGVPSTVSSGASSSTCCMVPERYCAITENPPIFTLDVALDAVGQVRLDLLGDPLLGDAARDDVGHDDERDEHGEHHADDDPDAGGATEPLPLAGFVGVCVGRGRRSTGTGPARPQRHPQLHQQPRTAGSPRSAARPRHPAR